MVLYDSVQKYIENHLDDVVVDGLSWRSDAARIKQRQDELFYQTLRFDLANTPEYWPRVFGDRPLGFEARVERAFAYIQQLPPLIPIGGLKFYVPTVTSDMNQPLPVISFHQFVDSILWSQDINSYEQGVPGDLSQVPEITGWRDVLDGLGADVEALYI